MENKNQPILKSLRAILWVLVIVALGALIYQTFLRARHSINDNPLQSAKSGSFSAMEVLPKPPSIKAQKFLDKDGKEITLADISGKIKVVNIWATWCAPCVREMPELAIFSAKHKGKGVIIIPISLDKGEDADKARAKLKELSGGAFDFYSDPKMDLPFALGVKGFPTTIFYDEQNNEIARIPSAPKWDDAEADGIIEGMLASRKN